MLLKADKVNVRDKNSLCPNVGKVSHALSMLCELGWVLKGFLLNRIILVSFRPSWDQLPFPKAKHGSRAFLTVSCFSCIFQIILESPQSTSRPPRFTWAASRLSVNPIVFFICSNMNCWTLLQLAFWMGREGGMQFIANRIMRSL